MNQTLISRHSAIFGPLCFIWCVLVTVDVLLGFFVAESAVSDPQLTIIARVGVACANAVAIGAVVVFVGTPLLWMWQTRPENKTRLVAIRRVGIVLAVWLLTLAYLSSWAIFRDTGQFLDSYSVEMSQANPFAMAEHAIHMRPVETILGPVIALVVALGMTLALPRWKWLTQRVTDRQFVRFARYVVLLAVLGAVVGESLAGRSEETRMDVETGITYQLGELYAFSRDDRTGPLAHGLADLRRALWNSDPYAMTWVPGLEDGVEDEHIHLTYRPQVSMEEYLSIADSEKVHRYNVIVLLVESLRPDQLQSFGGMRDVMPNLDSIAADSLTLTNAYTQASHSNYADMCVLSSHYPLRDPRIHIYPKDPTYPRVLIHDILKSTGYRTSVFSSQNEVWGHMINYLDTGNIDRLFHAGNFTGDTYVCREDIGFSDWAKGGKKSGKIDDRITVYEAIRWIGDSRQPFCMYMNLQNSHIPYVTPADFPRQFAKAKPHFVIAFNNYPKTESSLVKDYYSDSLAYIDAQIGRLVDHLKETGQWDDTVLVVSGDTGQAFYEHGFAAHGNRLYNEVMQVPLIVRIPGSAGRTDNRPTQHIDVPPTIMAALGLPAHPSFQGTNLLQQPSDRRALYMIVQTPLAHQVAVVRDDYKLILDMRARRQHLYDLRQDPGERHDIASQRPQLSKEMATRLYTWCNAQLDYYRDRGKQAKFCPPIVED